MTTIVRTSLALALAGFLISGCGGGGGSGGHDDALDEVPSSASSSAKALVRYLSDLVDSLADGETREPVSIETFDPVRPDDTEPESLS